jgi:SAM-dependent methyltransferase
VISLFHVLSYQTSNDEVARGFANAARHLRPNGIFFFDVWHGPAVLRQVPEVRIKRVEDESVRLIRIAEPALNTNESLVRVRYTIVAQSTTDNSSRIFQEEHLMRYFFPTEIELLAAGAGFEIERSEEFLTGNVPSEDTWGVAYILRKST